MAEKFRPRQIGDVVGQDTVKNLIRRSLRNQSFPQFSIMYGPSGSGKSTMAEISGLAITCESPENGEPCCQCKSCLTNLELLDKGHSSMNLCKINMGAIERTDFKQTIKEVFTLKPAMGDNAVYIFEEIQALTKDEQNILLEYISNISKNIYVIACTTEYNKLRQELRNRAIKFQFRSLKTDEAITLLERVCKDKGIKKPTQEIAKYLVRSVSNCPREIVNVVDFLADAESLDDESLSEYLGYVSNRLYITYFQMCKKNSFEFAEWLESIEDSEYINIVRGIRNFTIDCYGYVFGGNTQYFNNQEKHDLKELFGDVDEDTLQEIMMYFNTCKFDDETSAKFCLIAGRRFMNKKTIQRVMKESKREASRAAIQSEEKTKKVVKENNKVERISESSLDSLLGGLSMVEK